MARRSTAPESRRSRADSRRERRLTASFTNDELDEIRAAAARSGLTPGAWMARLATDVAGGATGDRSLYAALADAVHAMSEATEAARIIGRLFGQAVARLDATGKHSPELEVSGGEALRAVLSMQSATLRAARELLK